MKKNFYFGALAALALGLGFSSCASEEPDNNGDQTQTATGTERYMAVRISTAGLDGTRSAEDGGFEDPVGSEGNISAENVRFYFFDAEGNPYTMAVANVNGVVSYTNMVKPSTVGYDNTNGTASEATAQLVLGTPEHGYEGTTPSQVFCVVNAMVTESQDNFVLRYSNKPLSELQSASTYVQATPTQFVMTSSTYVEDGNVVCTSKITSDNLCDTAEDAQNNPVNIYIERLAAKIRVTGLKSYPALNEKGNVATYSFATVDDEGQIIGTHTHKLNVVLEGWRPMFTALASYSVKNVSSWVDNAPNGWTEWNVPDLHRCYWAWTLPAVYTDNAYFRYSTYNLESSTFLDNYDKDNSSTVHYCYESTNVSDEGNQFTRKTKAPAIVVKGRVVYADNCEDGEGNSNEMEGKEANIVYWAGTYYEHDSFMKMAVNRINLTRPDSKITIDNLELAYTTKDNLAELRIYDDEHKEYTTSTTFQNMKYWNGGLTSYYTTIQHLGGLNGVVRNHIYDYEFDGVVGLGAPGNDMDDPVDEDETYLAARVNVLNWHVVSNKITLQ